MSYDLGKLRAAIKPFELHWFPRLLSTNSHALRMLRAGRLAAPAIVLTGRQTCGRGQRQQGWWSNRDCITVTFVLSATTVRQASEVPLRAGVIVHEVVTRVTGRDDVQIKWPNDIVVGRRKLAGLLCERIDGVDLVGVGLNVNTQPSHAPKSLQNRITSMHRLCKRKVDLTDALAALANAFARNWSSKSLPPFAAVLKHCNNHHVLTGKAVTIELPADHGTRTGVCVGLDPIGALLLRDQTRVHHVVSGHVRSWKLLKSDKLRGR